MLTLLALALLVSQTASQTVLQTGNIRVIDAETKQPIAGAVVSGVQEKMAPVAKTFWFQAADTTGADGWATLPLPTDEAHFVWRIVRAEGYAVSGSMQVPREGAEPEIVELHRVVPAKVRVVDFLGQPVAGLYLGFCVGCGHTPDVASAVTDADGRVTFHCVGREGRDIADVYPAGEGVLTTELWIDWDAALDGGYEALATPGGTLEGQVLLPDGSPAAGYSVGVPVIHRGPWARTDDAGRFRLMGLYPGDVAYVHVKDRSGETVAEFDDSRTGLVRTLRMPEEKLGDTAPVADALLSFECTASDVGVDHAALWRSGVPLQVWDPVSGWCRSLELAVGEPTEIELAAGSYELEIGGVDGPYRRVRLGRVEVAAGGEPTVVTHELAPIRVTRLEVRGIDLKSRVGLLSSCGVWTEVEFDSIDLRAGEATGVGVVEAFVVPAEPFGMWLGTEARWGDVFLEMTGRETAGAVIRAGPRPR